MLLVLSHKLFGGRQHDRWCPAALTAGWTQSETERRAEDVDHGHSERSAGSRSTGLASEAERAAVSEVRVGHGPPVTVSSTWRGGPSVTISRPPRTTVLVNVLKRDIVRVLLVLLNDLVPRAASAYVAPCGR